MKSLLIALFLIPLQLFAKANDGGCFDPAGKNVNNKLSQSGMTFTNAISSPVTTTAMASGTSGCKVSGFVRAEDREAGIFYANHVHEIKSELASGNHEYLLGFEDLVGCKGHTSTVVASMKSADSPLLQPAHSDQKFLEWLQTLKRGCRI